MVATPDRINRYEVQEVIGRGAMGRVFLARDSVIGREVALKTIDFLERIPADQRAESQKRFEREARAAGVLSHPNIVTVYDVGKDDAGCAYIAFEFVNGRTLRQIVPEGARCPTEQILGIALQVAQALHHAHRHGIVHRDVKPDNILVRDDGLVKLADFGVARIEASELTRHGEPVGSPSYSAPEMLRGQPVDGRADLFSLGVTLFEVLTGVKPFRGETVASLYQKILSEMPSPPSRWNPSLAPKWDTVIMKLLAKDPENRYRSAEHLIEELRCLEISTSHHDDPGELQPDIGLEVEVKESRGEGVRSQKILLALLLLALLALAIFLVAPFSKGQAQGQLGVQPESVTPVEVAPATVDLTVLLDHRLRSGRIGIKMDGQLLFEESFRGEGSKMRVRGVFSRQVQIPAGKHLFEVTVDNTKGKQLTHTSTREVPAGTDPTLFVTIHGLFRKKLALTWL